MDQSIIWTAKALADLEAIVKYITANDPAVAARIGQEILDRVEILHVNPMAGSALREETDSPYRKLIYRRWKIIYTLREEKVIIMRIWPAAMGPVDFEVPL